MKKEKVLFEVQHYDGLYEKAKIINTDELVGVIRCFEWDIESSEYIVRGNRRLPSYTSLCFSEIGGRSVLLVKYPCRYLMKDPEETSKRFLVYVYPGGNGKGWCRKLLSLFGVFGEVGFWSNDLELVIECAALYCQYNGDVLARKIKVMIASSKQQA